MIYEFKFCIRDTTSFDLLKSILYFHAKKQTVEYAESFQEDLEEYGFYFFYIKTSKDAMIAFAEAIGKSIPLSINFSFEELKEFQDDAIEIEFKLLDSCLESSDEEIFDASCIAESMQSYSIENIKKWVQDIKYHDILIEKQEQLEGLFEECLNKAKTCGVVIETSRGKKILTTQIKEQKSQLMFCDMSNLKTYMCLDTLQSQLLASYEKPSMYFVPKEVFMEELQGNLFECFLPYDVFLGAFANYCLKSEINYLFACDSDEKPLVTYCQKQGVVPMQNVVVSQSGVVLHTQKYSGGIFELIKAHYKSLEMPSKQRIQNEKNLVVCLSKENPTLFWIGKDDKYQSVIQMEFELNPRKVVQEISTYTDGDKLIKNFYAQFGEIQEKIEKMPLDSIKTSNIFEFLSVLAFMGNYDKEPNRHSCSILNNARRYVRDKGPRIDYKIIKNEKQHLVLEYPKILRSMMSFLLAGVDEATLSYGVLDSMAECFGNLIQDICVNFSIQNVLIFGSLLEEKIFLDKILHYAPKNINLVLPKNGYLDYQ